MYQKIMVPLDGSKLAECVLPHVKSIAEGCRVKSIIFVRAVEPVEISVGRGALSFTSADIQQADIQQKADAEGYLKNVVNQLKLGGMDVQWEVVIGEVAHTIVDYAENHDVDLIVMASHGRSGASRWVFGSVADRVLHSVNMPVLMVRVPQ